MKTLLIDDLREIEADVVARSYDAGINALKNKGPFDLLLLDHDLGEDHLDDDGHMKTGYGIMCWLEENQQYLPERIQLVTSNPVGRTKMQTVIDRLYKSDF